MKNCDLTAAQALSSTPSNDELKREQERYLQQQELNDLLGTIWWAAGSGRTSIGHNFKYEINKTRIKDLGYSVEEDEVRVLFLFKLRTTWIRWNTSKI